MRPDNNGRDEGMNKGPEAAIGCDMPLVSVVLPIFNAGAYLEESIESVLKQSSTNIEVILVDDCSSDGSLQVCQRFAAVDKRVRVVKRFVNGGIVAALNDGLAESRGEFIARMDADDVAMPERFSKQLEYFCRYPEVGLCGTSIEVIDHNNKSLAIRLAETDPELVRRLLRYGSPIAHPTWMMRRAVLDKLLRYRDVAPVEDYDFLRRVAMHGIGVGNIEYIGLKYRILPTSISSTRTIAQRKGFALLRAAYRKGVEIDEQIFSRLIHSSPWLCKVHALAEWFLQKAVALKSKKNPAYFVFLLCSLICSPYQAMFFFDIVRKKIIIKMWARSRA